MKLYRSKVRDTIAKLLTKPTTAMECLNLLKTKNINVNKTTVYRDIEILTKLNIIRPIIFDDGQIRYESTQDHHHHLVCKNCRQIIKIDLEMYEKKLLEFEKKFKNDNNFLDVTHSLEFFGTCKKCHLTS